MSRRPVRTWQPAAAAILLCMLWLAGCTARVRSPAEAAPNPYTDRDPDCTHARC